MKNIIDSHVESFIEKLLSRCNELKWRGWVVGHTKACQAYDKNTGVFITLRLALPKYSRINADNFNVEDHQHWYSITLEDPTWRWGMEKILNISAGKSHPDYGTLESLFKTISSITNFKDPTEQPSNSSRESALVELAKIM